MTGITSVQHLSFWSRIYQWRIVWENKHTTQMFMFIFKATDITQQKKAYRILEQICGADSESSLKFVVSHLKELQDILLKTLASSSSASKTVSSTSSAKYNWWTYYTIQDYFVKLQKTRTGYIHSIGRPQIHLCFASLFIIRCRT